MNRELLKALAGVELVQLNCLKYEVGTAVTGIQYNTVWALTRLFETSYEEVAHKTKACLKDDLERQTYLRLLHNMIWSEIDTVGLAAWGVWKKPSLGLFAGYLFLILAETVFIRKPFTGSHFQPELFWSWRAWKVQRSQILTNVIMFIPVGILAGWLWKWKGLWFAAGLSLTVEALQLITKRGLMEFDDVLHNFLGATVGIVILIFVRKLITDMN